MDIFIRFVDPIKPVKREKIIGLLKVLIRNFLKLDMDVFIIYFYYFIIDLWSEIEYGYFIRFVNPIKPVKREKIIGFLKVLIRNFLKLNMDVFIIYFYYFIIDLWSEIC